MLRLPPPLRSPQKEDQEATYVKKHVAPEVDEDGFEKVKPRKKRRRSQKKLIQGEMTGCKLQGAPEPSRDVYVGRLLPSFGVQDIKDHAAQAGLHCLEAEKLSSETARLSSFRVKVRRADAATALMGRIWPLGSVVGKFYPPVPPRQPEGVAGTAANLLSQGAQRENTTADADVAAAAATDDATTDAIVATNEAASAPVADVSLKDSPWLCIH